MMSTGKDLVSKSIQTTGVGGEFDYGQWTAQEGRTRHFGSI